MTYISTAVSQNRRSTVVGYELKVGTRPFSSNYLPQRVVIIGEGASSNQSNMPLTSTEVITANDAAKLYGYGSPIHKVFNILKPNGRDLLGGIPTFVIAQEEGESSVACNVTIGATGTPLANTTHTIYVAGRPYLFDVLKTDSAAEILLKIADAINIDSSSPVVAAAAATEVSLTAKWKGLTSNFTVDFMTGTDTSIAYAEVTRTDGAGTPDLSDLSDKLGNEWTTIVINTYGQPAFDILETINGRPDRDIPTGRYSMDFIPFIAIWGSTESSEVNLANITDQRKLEVTNALAPAPNSPGFAFEAAANMAILFANNSQDSPHASLINAYYVDMPLPLDNEIGNMKEYAIRDFLVKKGCSTVELHNERYRVKDFVTTYHPDGESTPTFRWPRNIMIDFNVRYQILLAEQVYLIGKSIVGNDTVTSVDGVIRPVDWKAIIFNLASFLSELSLIFDAESMQQSIRVEVNKDNPDRFDTIFDYTSSGVARISSTTATVYRQSATN